MNRCDEYQELLSALIDEMLPEDDKNVVEQHLLNCEPCAQSYEILKTIVSACNELEEELPEGFEATLHQRLVAAKEEASAQKSRIPKIRLFSQIAAGFVFVITLGLVMRTGLFLPQMKSSENSSSGASAAPQSALHYTGKSDDMVGKTAVIEDSGIQYDARITSTARGISGIEEKTEGNVTTNSIEVTDRNALMMSLTQGEDMHKNEGHDTIVRIATNDLQTVINAVSEIQEGLGDTETANQLSLMDAKMKQQNDNTITEIKLTYSNDQLWHEFLSALQVVFPEMQVESVPAQEEEQYIRIQIDEP